jgi:hypothetical protein
MNQPEAREHLDIVERILARSDEPACVSAFPFVVWGIAAAIMNCVAQVLVAHQAPTSVVFVAVAALLAAIILMVFWVRRLGGAERRTLIDRTMALVFNIAWIVALVAQVGSFNIFAQWAQAAIWSVMYGAALLFAGTLVRNRVVLAGGIVLLISVVVANFVLPYAGYVLALGDLVGMAGAGALLYAGRR